MMKYITLLLSAFVLFILATVSSCQNNGVSNQRSSDSLNMMKDSASYTTVSFPDSMQNFGSVEKGKQVKLLFHIKNTGVKPLLIADARPSCGCTVADFTKSAIGPGKEGEINASFDSDHGMPGQVRKTITVTTNTSPQHTTLVFMGDVKPSGDAAKTK